MKRFIEGEHDWTNVDIVKLLNITSTSAQRGEIGIVDSDSILPPSVTVTEVYESISMQSIQRMVMETQAKVKQSSSELYHREFTQTFPLCVQAFLAIIM